MKSTLKENIKILLQSDMKGHWTVTKSHMKIKILKLNTWIKVKTNIITILVYNPTFLQDLKEKRIKSNCKSLKSGVKSKAHCCKK